MDDVYELLKAIKTPNESFSDEIRRLAKTKGSIMEFAGAWKNMSAEDERRIKAKIEEIRKSTRISENYKER